MKVWAWVILFAISLPNWAAERHMSDSDYWRTAHLTLSYSKNFISNSLCYSSAEYLFSCVEAVNAGGDFMNSPIQIVPTDQVTARALILKQTPDLTVVDEAQINPVPGHSPLERADNAELLREHLIQASHDHFSLATKPDARINFEGLIKTIMGTLPRTVPTQMMLGAAITAQLRVFDAHAALIPAAREDAYLNGGSQPFCGIGVNLRMLPNGMRIDEVFKNSPADKAGLKAGDLVTEITSRPGDKAVATEGKQLISVTDLISGPRGVVVKLAVNRGGKNMTFRIPRGKVQIQNVVGGLIRYDHSEFGYIRIRTFMASGICSKVQRQLGIFEHQRVRGVILDLRRNPGGLLNEGVCVASLFLGREKVVGIKSIQVTLPGHETDFSADVGKPVAWQNGALAKPTKLPTVVLVDGASASASEIVSGALQAHERAWLVGEKTYGKGSVQTSFQLDDNASLILTETTARFYLPSGMTNQRVGIEPDFTVPFQKDATAVERFTPREVNDYPNGLPPLNPPQKEQRPDEVARIKNCVNANDRETKILEAFTRTGETQDFQKAYALAVLECSPTMEAVRTSLQ